MKVCIAGGGRVGRYLAQSLLTNHHSVVIIEPIEAQCRMLADSLDIPVICGCLLYTSGQGFPVFLGTAGQLFGIQTGILDAAGHAVLVGQQGLGIGLNERPGIGKALLVIGAQAVEPLGIRCV